MRVVPQMDVRSSPHDAHNPSDEDDFYNELTCNTVAEKQPITSKNDDDDDDILQGEGEEGRDQLREILSTDTENLELDATEVNVDDIHQITIDRYDQTIVKINLDQLVDPDSITRLSNLSHIRNLCDTFKQNGYVPSSGYISVVYKDQNNVSVQPNANNQILRNSKLYIVDGRNRLAALRKLAEIADKWNSLAKQFSVVLWTRSDFKPMKKIEILLLSSFLNESSKNIMPVSFQDRVHNVVSMCRILCEEHNLKADELSLSSVVKILFITKTLGKMETKQLRRYSRIGLFLTRHDDAFTTFEDITSPGSAGERIGITHVSFDGILSMSSHCFTFVLDSITRRIKCKIKGCNFEALCSDYYKLAMKLMKILEDFSNKIQVPVKELYGFQVKISQEEQTVYDYLCGQLFRVSNSLTAKGIDRKTKNLQTRLENLPLVINLTNNTIPPNVSSHSVALMSSPTEDAKRQDFSIPEDPVPPSPLSPQSKQDSIQRIETIDEIQPNQSSKIHEGSSSDHEQNKSEALQGVRRSFRLQSKIASEEVKEVKNKNALSIPYYNKRCSKEILEDHTTKKRRMATQDKSFQSDIKAFEKLIEKLPRKIIIEVIRKTKYRIDVPILRCTSPDDENDDGHMRMNNNDSITNLFDDRVPETLPFGYTAPEPYTGELSPIWLHYAYIDPRFKEAQIRDFSGWHPHPWLDLLFITKEHRANIFFQDIRHLLRIQRLAYLQGSFNKALEMSKEENILFESIHPRSKLLSGMKKTKYFSEIRIEFPHIFFTEKRAELDIKGYTIFDGFLDTNRFPELSANVHLDNVRSLFDKIQSLTPDRHITDDLDNNSKYWNYIINEGEGKDGDDRLKGVGRIQTANETVMSFMESEEMVQYGLQRASLDLFIAQCLHLLHVCDNRKNNVKLYTTKTGGRWLYTLPNSPRQTIHTDFPSLTSEEISSGKCPGYFAIATGPFQVSIWCVTNSHTIVAHTPPDKITSLSKSTEASLCHIPSYSIFIGRGDFWHAGSSFDDMPEGTNNIRYHMYFVPSNYNLPNAGNLIRNYRPRFTERRDKKNLFEDFGEHAVHDS